MKISMDSGALDLYVVFFAASCVLGLLGREKLWSDRGHGYAAGDLSSN